MQDKIMELVSQICNTESTNCRSLNKVDIARKLLNIANVPTTAEIQEIPLDCNNQVVILFLLSNDNNYYSLFAGIGTDNNFHFELAITGTLKDDIFDFYDEEKEIDIYYFVKQNMKKITIQTSYSTETYYCKNIDDFLADICFCDDYEVIKEENAEPEKITLYTETLEKLQNDKIKIDSFWNTRALLVVCGYYETYQEMIDNK